MGVSRYVLKPVKQSELYDAVNDCLGEHVQRAQNFPAEYAKTSNSRCLRILLAEDNLVNQKLAIGLLEREGHQIFIANNGKEAFAASAAQSFDVVLMDIEMPEMDGLEATAAIRLNEQRTGKHVPIIAMTAHAMQGDRERCLASGMDGYLSKPIRMRLLVDTLNSLFASDS